MTLTRIPGPQGRPNVQRATEFTHERSRHLARTAESWLDERGRGAWIALTILAFIFFWPAGLALLGYMIWSKRMFRGCSSARDGEHRRRARGWERRYGFRSSGNTAFDAYKADTLRRLQEEQDNFESFLARLREARDKAEFDQFMEDRTRRAREEGDHPEGREDDPKGAA